MGTSISCWRATSTAYRPCGGATMRAMACCCAERGGRGGRRSLRCGRPGAERSHDRRAGAASRARQAGRRGPSDRRGAEQRQAADSAPTSPPAARPDLEAVEGSIYVPMDRPRLTFWQMYNMSFGFLGIQFGWGLQLANMSAVYERLGARPDQVPLLWLPAPLTRPLVQAVVGAPSRPPWGRLGRRRPYFLTGALLASIALFLMPTSRALWMAAGLLWILDASINISMEPFRAFVADKLDVSQRTAGFVMQ